MLYFVSFVVILFLAIIITSFVNRFTLIRIEGHSMSPTYRNGQFRIVDRRISPEFTPLFGERVREGMIFVYFSPSGSAVIKRLIQVVRVTSTENFYWFEGDNKENSEDSRSYGFIKEERIFGEVIGFGTFLKRTFSKKSDFNKRGKNECQKHVR